VGSEYMKTIPLACTLIVGLAACQQLTSTATDERLDALRSSGLDTEKRDAIDERLTVIEDREGVSELLETFDTDNAASPREFTLAQALDQALEGNIDIGRAAQDINAADVERLAAIFGYLPQVRATASRTQIQQEVIRSDNTVFNAGTANYGSLDYALEIEQPLLDMSRIFQIRIANTARSGAEVAYLAAVQRAMFETFDAYLTAGQAQQRRQSLQRRASLVSRQIRRERDRAETGVSDPAAVIALQQSYNAILVDAAAAEIAQARALGDLSRLAGAPIDRVEIPAFPRNMRGVERSTTVAQAISSAVENNPTILQSIVELAEYDLRRLQSINADFTPVITAFGRLVNEDRQGSRFGGGSETQDMIVGVRIVVPLFNADGQGYRMLTSQIDFEQAALAYANEKRQVSAQIRGVHGQLVNLTKAIGRAQSAAASARRLVAAERARVDAGTSQPFVVTELQSRELAARATVQEYQMDYFRAWGELQYLTGEKLAENL
jgi:outer membrane protein TolC